jgi:hypothetical protein
VPRLPGVLDRGGTLIATLGGTAALPRTPVFLDCLTAAASDAVRSVDGIEAPTLRRQQQGNQREF